MPGSLEFHRYLAEYAQSWAAQVRSVREAFSGLPGLYHEVRYEDLLASPEQRLADILGFLGVDASAALVRRIVEENSFSRLSGGRDSGQEDHSSFYRKGTAGNWRAHFDARAREVFAEASGGLLAELGYEG